MIPTTILLATDLSCRCDRALDRATALAAEWRARLVVLHAQEELAPVDDLPSWRRPADAQQVARKRVQRDLRNADGLDFEVLIQKGDAVPLIVNAVKNHACGLIVTGVARNETLGRFHLGATVNALMHKTEVPVLVVKTRSLGSYRKVIVATDLSEGSRGALETALTLLPAAHFTLFYTYEIPFLGMVDDKVRALDGAAQQAKLEVQGFLAATPAAAGRTIQIICEHGEIGALLEELAETQGADLIVLGTKGRSGLAGLLLGSVAKYLLSRVSTDVLVVPERQRPA